MCGHCVLGAPAMSMPGCIPVWGLLPAPPPSLALSVSLSGPLSCQSAFCGLLRDEESEQFHVTSVATASSGRGFLGYLAAPAALTVRNCLISKVTSGKSSESSMTVRRPTDGGRPNPRGSLEGVPQSTGRFRWPECPSWPHLNRAVYMLKSSSVLGLMNTRLRGLRLRPPGPWRCPLVRPK